MAKNNGKVIERIEKVLDMVAEGTYSIDRTNGKLSKGDKVLKGSVGTEDGQQWYTVKGMSIQGQRLAYAYYHGVSALTANTDSVVKHLDGNKLNNGEDNLVLVSKKGWKEQLEAMRQGQNIDPNTPPAPAEPTGGQTWNEKELEARAIWMELVNGLTIKEVAEKLDVKKSRVYDVKRGKSNRNATADLPEIA